MGVGEGQWCLLTGAAKCAVRGGGASECLWCERMPEARRMEPNVCALRAPALILSRSLSLSPPTSPPFSLSLSLSSSSSSYLLSLSLALSLPPPPLSLPFSPFLSLSLTLSLFLPPSLPHSLTHSLTHTLTHPLTPSPLSVALRASGTEQRPVFWDRKLVGWRHSAPISVGAAVW